MVPSTLVLGHIQKLRKAGIGYKAIAAATCLAQIDPCHDPHWEAEQIRRHHAARILAVDKSAIEDHALVPTGRTWALLNDLLEGGYTKTFLFKQLDSRAKRPSLQIRTDRITTLGGK